MYTLRKRIYLPYLLILFVSCNASVKDLSQQNIHLKKIGPFPAQLQECSGMVFFNDNLLALNDSGNTTSVFQIDPSNADLLKEIKLKGVVNTDWEAMSLINDTLLIGNFGNNKGHRKDRNIYQFLTNTNLDIRLNQSYPFIFDDQKDFRKRKKHNFDCESMVSIDGQWIFFSKNRQDTFTHVYHYNKQKGRAIKMQSFSVPVRVTDACYVEDHKKVYLLCNVVKHGKELVYIKILKVKKNQTFEEGPTIPLAIPEQAEAICYDGSSFYIGTEKETTYGGNLYKLNFKK